MSNSKKTIQNNSRRNFLYQSSLASLGLVFMGKNTLAANSFFLANPNSKIKGVQIGAITYSFRSMPGSAEQLIQYLKEAGISAIELMGDPAEAYAGSPVGNMPKMTREEYMKTMEERNAKARAWRETASMDKFVELRKLFNDAGITIYAYKPDAALGVKSTDGEIDYAMRAAKALGATSVKSLAKLRSTDQRLTSSSRTSSAAVGSWAPCRWTTTCRSASTSPTTARTISSIAR